MTHTLQDRLNQTLVQDMNAFAPMSQEMRNWLAGHVYLQVMSVERGAAHL